MQQREDNERIEEVQHPSVTPNVSQVANHPTGANSTFYPPFFPWHHMLINQCLICHPAIVAVPSVGSSHGHVGSISSDADAVVSSELGGTSGVSI
jgi:hypothetical protein